ncbi:hypothetical protein ACFL6Y_04065 [Elusimicrobiota bacterium]
MMRKLIVALLALSLGSQGFTQITATSADNDSAMLMRLYDGAKNNAAGPYSVDINNEQASPDAKYRYVHEKDFDESEAPPDKPRCTGAFCEDANEDEKYYGKSDSAFTTFLKTIAMPIALPLYLGAAYAKECVENAPNGPWGRIKSAAKGFFGGLIAGLFMIPFMLLKGISETLEKTFKS